MPAKYQTVGMAGLLVENQPSQPPFMGTRLHPSASYSDHLLMTVVVATELATTTRRGGVHGPAAARTPAGRN